jgi:hypothetical protein
MSTGGNQDQSLVVGQNPGDGISERNKEFFHQNEIKRFAASPFIFATTLIPFTASEMLIQDLAFHARHSWKNPSKSHTSCLDYFGTLNCSDYFDYSRRE